MLLPQKLSIPVFLLSANLFRLASLPPTKCVLVFLFAFFAHSTLKAQTFKQQQREVFVINILSNGIMGVIGGAIRKAPGEKFLPVFMKNFGRACAGGALKYTAKAQTYPFRFEQFNGMIPINRALFFLGHSVSLNAAHNQPMFSSFNFNLYGVNVEIHPSSNKGQRLQARVSAATSLTVLAFLIDGNKLDLPRTLEFGQFYFEKGQRSKIALEGSRGFAGFNAITIEYQNDVPLSSIVPHEIIHTYQAYDPFPIASYFNQPIVRQFNRLNFYEKLTKVIDFDYQPLVYSLLYLTQPKPTYFNNYFEFEAELLGTRRPVWR